MLCGFAIRSRGACFTLLGDYKSPGLIGRTFFYGGFQIRRDANSIANIYFFFEKAEILLFFSPLYILKEERRGKIKLASKKICENF